MAKRIQERLPEDIQQALTDTGLPYEVRPGTKHLKIFLRDHLVGIFPKSGRHSHEGRGSLNIIAQIRRAARA